MKLAIVQNLPLLALLSFMANGEAIVGLRIQNKMVGTQGGFSLAASNDQIKSINLRVGDLSPGSYKYFVTVNNGTIHGMKVHDGSSKVYADAASGWGWSSLYSPNEIAFTLSKARKDVAFSASTESRAVDFDYKLITI